MADENIKDGNATEPNNDLDAAFTKHLDIAIEAQDGPTDKNPETKTDAEAGKTNTEVKPDTGDGSTKQPDAQPNAGQEGKKEEQPAHGAKDLTLQDGTTIKGGQERRFFEQRNVARERATVLEQERDRIAKEHTTLQTKYDDLERTVTNLNGAKPQEVAVGLNIVRDLQRDPQGTMQKLLAEVIAQGYTIEGIGAGIDTAAITRLIEERLPKQGASEQDNIARITEEATQEANTFFSNHPDAKPHDELLARMLSDNPGLSLQSAYFQLKDAFASKGYDWTLPLKDNVERGQTNSEKKTDDNPNPNDKPLPNGGNGLGTDVVINRGNLSNETDDTGDIVRQAMRESGMNI